MNRYNICMVGSGYMARKHCSALQNHPNAKLDSLVTSDKNKPGDSFKKEFGFENVFNNIDDALSDKADIVFITSPNLLHTKQVLKSLEKNKNVFCEKPLAYTREEFNKINSSLAKNKGILQVGMNCRFREQYSIPKKIIDECKLGKLKFIRATYIFDITSSFNDKQWWKDYPKGIFPFLHTGAIHALDLFRWLGGEIKYVSAFGNGIELEKDWGIDNFTVNVEFKSGAIGEMTFSATAKRPSDFNIEIWGTQGSIIKNEWYKNSSDKETIEVKQDKMDLVLQFENMLNAIERKSPPLNSFDEALKNLELITAIENSVKQKKTIEL